MKKITGIIVAALLAAPFALAAQSYTSQSGVSLFTAAPATVTQTGTARLPTFSGVGTLTITGTGITGSPSGCTVTLAFQSNNATVATSVVSTTSFTPGNTAQTFTIVPTVASGDNYVATYACSSTYPTAGTVTASFSPIPTNVLANFAGVGDPCKNPAAATVSAVVNIGSATTTQIVALAAGKQIYVCQVSVSATGTTPSVLLAYGTGSACGTGTTSLTGAIALTASQPMSIGWGGAVVTTPAGNALCVTNVGSTLTGVISYVQQ